MGLLTIGCESPVKFLDWLDLNGPKESLWKSWGPAIFRGLSSANYSLLPTALHQGVKFPIDGEWKVPITEGEQIRGELELLDRFINKAEANGFHIPGDSSATKQSIKSLLDAIPRQQQAQQNHPGDWPPNEILQSLALARHHGIPTRMLDWSTDPLISATFAAIGAAKRYHSQGSNGQTGLDLAVVCCKQDVSIGGDILMDFARKAGGIHYLSPKTVRISDGGNPNLCAQQGLFTIMQREKIDFNNKVTRTSCEEVLCQESDSSDHDGYPKCVLFRVTLPISHSAALLVELAKREYSSTRLFPSLDGVAKAVLNEALWR